MSKKIRFEHDNLTLSKSEIIKIVDNLIKRWKLNWQDNLKIIAIAETFKMLIKVNADKKIAGFWVEFWNEADNVRYRNKLKELPEVLQKTYDD